MTKTFYKVYDLYENDVEFLGTFESYKDAKAAGKERVEDTEGECPSQDPSPRLLYPCSLYFTTSVPA